MLVGGGRNTPHLAFGASGGGDCPQTPVTGHKSRPEAARMALPQTAVAIVSLRVTFCYTMLSFRPCVAAFRGSHDGDSSFAVPGVPWKFGRLKSS